MAADLICDVCGESNPPTAQFCGACNAFLSWDGTTDADRTRVIKVVPDPARSTLGPTMTASRDAAGTTASRDAAATTADRDAAATTADRDAAGTTAAVVDLADETVRLPGSAVGVVASYRITGAPGAPGAAREATQVPEGGDAEPPFRVALQPVEISVLGSLPPATVEVTIENVSGIVEAYSVDVPDAPAWLDTHAIPVSLLPGMTGSARLTLAIVGADLVVAQRLGLRVRVRAESDGKIVRWADLAVVVPPVDGPIRLELLPSVVRVADRPAAEAVLRAGNPDGNRPVRLTLSGTDPELKIRFVFDPPVVEIPPGGESSARVIMQSPSPEPGRERSQAFTVAAADATRTVTATGTLVQVTSAPVIDPPVGVRLQPSLVRVSNSTVGELMVAVDNSHGRFPAGVELSGSDPELAVRFAFEPRAFTVPPGGSVFARARIEAPPPTPGGEATRQFTVTASVADRSGDRTGTAGGSFVQIADPIVAVGLQVQPAVVHARGGSARFELTVDNRGGMMPVRVSLLGADPERVVAFEFTPPWVDVPAGGIASAGARVRAPRPERGAEVSRDLDFWVDDGRQQVRARGTLIDSRASLRPLLRVLLTLVGVAAMVGGSFLDWTSHPPRSAVHWTVPVFGRAIHASNIFITDEVQRAVPSIFFSAAIVSLVLAAIALFGLTGKTGRLTRIAAVVGAVFVVAFLATLHFGGASGEPGVGAFIVVAGCVAAFCGGLLARR